MGELSWCDAVSAVATCIGLAGVVIGGGWALYRWTKEKKAQKAEFLERLLQKFRERKYERVLARLEVREEDVSSEYANESSVEQDAKTFEASEFLVFLSYVCYLRNRDIIDDKELGAFKCYVLQALANVRVREYLKGFYGRHRLRSDSGPYSELIDLWRKLSPESAGELCDQIDNESSKCVSDETNRRNAAMEVTIDDRPYKTHVEILNGLFHMDLLAHMKGAYRLNDEEIVWFPIICDVGKGTKEGDKWRNELLDNGKVLKEYWPKNTPKEVLDKWRGLKRFVFAKENRAKEGVNYWFKGVFVDNGQESDCNVYKRIETSFFPDQIN